MVEETSRDDKQDRLEEGAEHSDVASKDKDSTSSSDKKDDGKKSSSILRFLKDEKEMLTTVAFFTAGAFWLYAAFATKHYVGSVKCLLGATIERIDNEAQSRQLQAEMLDLNIQLRKLDGASLPPVELITQSEALKQKIEDSKTRKQLADAVVKKASQRVQNGECEE